MIYQGLLGCLLGCLWLLVSGGVKTTCARLFLLADMVWQASRQVHCSSHAVAVTPLNMQDFCLRKLHEAGQ